MLQDCREVWEKPKTSHLDGMRNSELNINMYVARCNIDMFGQVEACKVAQYPFSATQPIQELDWEVASSLKTIIHILAYSLCRWLNHFDFWIRFI